MYTQVIYIAIFLAVVACLPLLTKWLVRRKVIGTKSSQGASKLVSVLAVGPSQRVVTVEVGTDQERTLLVLGVTSQQITFLHRLPFGGEAVRSVATPAPNASSSSHFHL